MPAVEPLPAVFEAGCLPFAGVGAGAGSAGVSDDTVLYGGLGTLSGFCICICMEINSSSCFSVNQRGIAFSSSVVHRNV